MTAITFDKDYAWVILASAAIAFQIGLTGHKVGKLRKKLDLPYPDMGDGRFSAKLSDQDWEEFSNHQRAHYNYVEQISSVQTVLLLSGIFYPRAAASLGLQYIIGRAAFSRGYRKHGAKGRLLGAKVQAFALLGLTGLTFYGAAKLLLK